MNGIWSFDFDPLVVTLIPTIVVSTIECENPECEAGHGFAVNFVWGFWSLCLGLQW